MSIDRPSRCVVAWAAGPRAAAVADAVVQTTRQRTAGQADVPWISDGWSASVETILDVSCDPLPAAIHGWSMLRRTPGVGLTQAVKQRRRRRVVRVAIRAPIGPAAAQPYAVCIERFNGVLRDRLACLTRKTHAFAKQPDTWDAAVSVAVFEQNWVRPHPALRLPLTEPSTAHRYQRRTPAMVLGLTDHCWSLLEFLTHPVSHHTRG